MHEAVTFVQHCDWSGAAQGAARKRRTVRAQRIAGGWLAEGPDCVTEPGALISAAAAAASGGAALVGIDCPIGLPLAFAGTRPEPGFRAFLAALPDGFLRPAATLDQVSATRPFYPAARVAGAGAKALWLARLGLDAAALLRVCDRGGDGVRQACGLFWCVGANQVGKAAASAWREVLVPALHDPWLGLWPFDGALAALLRPGQVALAETYPAEAYARVLGPGVRLVKSRRDSRAAAAPALRRWMETSGVTASQHLVAAIADGFGPEDGGDDGFDATLGLFGMLDIVDGRHTAPVPDVPAIRAWEGWMLGLCRTYPA